MLVPQSAQWPRVTPGDDPRKLSSPPVTEKAASGNVAHGTIAPPVARRQLVQ
jgi:hypothetical protein